MGLAPAWSVLGRSDLLLSPLDGEMSWEQLGRGGEIDGGEDSSKNIGSMINREWRR